MQQVFPSLSRRCLCFVFTLQVLAVSHMTAAINYEANGVRLADLIEAVEVGNEVRERGCLMASMSIHVSRMRRAVVGCAALGLRGSGGGVWGMG